MDGEREAPAELRVLLLPATRRDGEITGSLLTRHGVECQVCPDIIAMSGEADHGLGGLLLTDMAFLDPRIGLLLMVLRGQPAWSDIPVILLQRSGARPLRVRDALASLTNVTVLERPTTSRTLLSSVQAALRARVRQYQLRDQLAALRLSEAALRDSEQRFRTLADAIPQLAWSAHPDGCIHWYNRRWYDYTGTTLEQVVNWGWQRVLDPEHRAAVLGRWHASIAAGTPFEMEYALRGADGQFRMFLTRIVPMTDVSGKVVQWFGTSTDIEESRRTAEQLRATERALRSADQRKDMFLATLAHELRNPLAPIRNAARILGSRPIDEDRLGWV